MRGIESAAGELAVVEREFRQATETVYRTLRDLGQSYEDADRFILETIQEAKRRDAHHRDMEIIREDSMRLAIQGKGLKLEAA
jgi:hypothetical protein